MMDTKTVIKELFHLLIPRFPNIPFENFKLWMLDAAELIQKALDHRCFLQGFSSFDGLLSSVHENHDLVTFFDKFRDLFVGDVV